MATQMQLEAILEGNRIAPASCIAETSKESIKTKTENGNCFCICVVMSTNLQCRAWERQWKRESRRQTSEAQREKGQQRSRARDKKQRRLIFVGKTTWKFCSGGEKMRNPSGHQCNMKMSGSEHSSVSTEELFLFITEASSWIHSDYVPDCIYHAT